MGDNPRRLRTDSGLSQEDLLLEPDEFLEPIQEVVIRYDELS